MNGNNRTTACQKLASYKKHPVSGILFLLVLGSTFLTITMLGFLLLSVLVRGVPHITLDLFAWEYTSENASLLPAFINTLLMTELSLVIAMPVGVFSAIYLVEYAKKGNPVVWLVRITTDTLMGIPSIVYGLFGMLFFVTKLKWRLSLVSGACTLAIMVLPVIMRTAEEALLAVPDQYRQGSMGLGAGKVRTIFRVVLPSAMPGICSGAILAIGRIVGETAALIYTAGSIPKVPASIWDSARTLSVHMYQLSKEGLYTDQAYATAVVLLALVACMNYVSGRLADV